MADFVFDAIALAEKYRNPAMILADGALGQMMEKVELPEEGSLEYTENSWATVGKPKDRERNIVTSLFIEPEKMEQINLELQEKYRKLKEEVRYELVSTEDAEILLVAYGLSARICQKTIELARAKGIKLGLLRPITLYPFPEEAVTSFASKVDFYLTVEMNAGQMIEDVKLAVNGKKPVFHYGRMGGVISSPEEVLARVEEIIEKHLVVNE